MQRRLFIPALFLCPVFLPGLLPPAAAAQERPLPPQPLSAPDSLSFPHSLKTLAERHRICIVAEGSPVARPAASSPAANRLPTEEAVRRAAEAFDYDIQHGGGASNRRVFTLVKRYSQPDDLPSITEEECRVGLRESLRALRALGAGDGKQPALIRSLFLSLRPEQIQQMDTGGGVPIAALSPAQRRAAEAVIAFTYVGPAEGYAAQTLKALEDMPKTAFVRRAWKDTEEEGEREVLGVSRPGRTVWPLHLVSGYPVRLTEPTVKKGSIGPATISLKELAEMLNKRVGSERYIVDPALQQKQITVIGSAHGEPDSIFKAAGEIYDLRLADWEGRKRLLRRSFRMPQRLSDLPIALRRALPVSRSGDAVEREGYVQRP